MINTGDALLQAILDEPDADDLRLIYADWLEDHGGNLHHSRYIRQQIAGGCAALPLSVAAPVTDVLLGVGLGFRGEVTNGYGSSRWENEDGIGIVWSRGFAHRIEAPLDTLLAHLPALLLRHPVREVRATDKRPSRYLNGCSEPHVCWWDIRFSDEEAQLPLKIRSRLTGAITLKNEDIRSEHSTDYPTEADALDALSRAVLEFCKEEARDTPVGQS